MALTNWLGGGRRPMIDEDQLPAILAASRQQVRGNLADDVRGDTENMSQPTGSLADLGRGVATGAMGTPNAFKRQVVRRGNRLLEAHVYGGGEPTRYFERKNPAVLAAAVRQAQTGRGASALQTGASLAGLPAQQGALSPRDEELLKLLLGNPTMRR